MKDFITGKEIRLTHEECQGLFDDYTKGRLDDWETALVQEHLVDCEGCSDALVEFIEKEIDAGNVPVLEAPAYPPQKLFNVFVQEIVREILIKIKDKKKAECLSEEYFEQYIMGEQQLTDKQHEHINQCPYYCQRVLVQLKDYGIRLWEVAADTVKQLRELFDPNQLVLAYVKADDGRDVPRMFRAVVEDGNGQINSGGKVEITDWPELTPDGYLVLYVSVIEPKFQLELCPIQLSLISLPDGQLIYTFELSNMTDQPLITKLPEDLLTQENWQHIKDAEELPFGFVIKAGSKAKLLARTKEIKNELPMSPKLLLELPKVDSRKTEGRAPEGRPLSAFSKGLARVAIQTAA